MDEMTLTTPALLFSALSFVLLAYTNRFLAYGSLVRSLHASYANKEDPQILGQISNVRKRLYLIRSMQFLGIFSMIMCVVSMFFLYIKLQFVGEQCFGLAMLLLILSLLISAREIQISVKAVEVQLKDIEKKLDSDSDSMFM